MPLIVVLVLAGGGGGCVITLLPPEARSLADHPKLVAALVAEGFDPFVALVGDRGVRLHSPLGGYGPMDQDGNTGACGASL